MKKVIACTIFCLFIIVIPSSGWAWLDYEVSAVQRLNVLEGDTGAAADMEAGFGETLFNLELKAELIRELEGQLVLEASEAEEVEISELFVNQREVIADVDLRLGRFEINYGDQGRYRSGNADVQDNYLVGNALVDPAVEQIGAELSGAYGLTGWSASVTNGIEGAGFEEDRGFAVTAKLWRRLFPGLQGSVSYYRVDHSTDDNGETTNFAYSGNSAAAYGGLIKDLEPNPLDEESKIDAYQADLDYDLETYEIPLSFYGHVGRLELEEDEVDYWSVEGRHRLGQLGHCGARYGALAYEEEGRVNRLQIGVGYEINPLTLAKLEYVNQDDNFEGSQGKHEFEGLVGEVSISW